jgi:hypothetical protein
MQKIIFFTFLTLPCYSPTAHSADSPADTLNSSVTAAIDTWSLDQRAVVTSGARYKLLQDAHTALDSTTKQFPELSASDVAKVVPAAVYKFLGNTQGNAKSATLAQLVQERIAQNGLVFPAISEYPTLRVDVVPAKPPDFVVSINSVAQPAGSANFRVLVGSLDVSVARSGHALCQKRLIVTATGPNVVRCP